MTNVYIEALEADKSGDWNTVHELIQDLTTSEAAWIHAYLHRKEGDNWNAKYCYNKAEKPLFKGRLEDEWLEIYKALGS